MKQVDIWSKGEVVGYLKAILSSGQIKDCNHLKVEQGPLLAFYPVCSQDWATRNPAGNVTLDSTAYRAPSCYFWPECPNDCPHYSRSIDFVTSLIREERKVTAIVSEKKELAGRAKIPSPVISVVGEVIGNHYYNHVKLNSLFSESGAPGEPPPGSCVHKCTEWLKRVNSDPSVNPFNVLGKILENFMELEIHGIEIEAEHWSRDRKRVSSILAKYGLSYHQGGQIIGGATGMPAKSLEEILATRNLTSVEAEFQRAIDNVEKDPATGVTAACSMIESLCKVYIEDEGLPPPTQKDIMGLWKVVKSNLGLDPKKLEDQDIVKILSSLASVTDGIGALRTHTSSAHGRGRKPYSLEPRHARLAIHGACSLVVFVIETWEARKKQAGQIT